MSRYTGAWVPFPRSALLLSRRDPLLRALMATLSAWAHPPKTSTSYEKWNNLNLKIGQLVTSGEELADDLGSERKLISRKLKILADGGFIRLQTKIRRGTLISVIHLLEKCPTESPRECPTESPNESHIALRKEPNIVPENVPENVPQNAHVLRNKNYERKEREERASAREPELSPPEKLSSYNQQPKIRNPNTSPEAKKVPPAFRNHKVVSQEPLNKEGRLKSLLGPLEVWEIYSNEMKARRDVKIFSPKPPDLKIAQDLLKDVCDREEITFLVKKYIDMERPGYVANAWPLRFLIQDLALVQAWKGPPKDRAIVTDEDLLARKKKRQEMEEKYIAETRRKMGIVR